MPTILFIVLTIVSQTTLWNQSINQHMIWKGNIGEIDSEIIDEWSTTISEGFSRTSGKAYYKAVLFTSKDALDRFLKENYVDDGILIDIKKGTQSKIRQKRIEKTVHKESQELDYYEVNIE